MLEKKLYDSFKDVALTSVNQSRRRLRTLPKLPPLRQPQPCFTTIFNTQAVASATFSRTKKKSCGVIRNRTW